jgi:RNA polymerase sigma-70 factor (ECF subfamily)
MRFRGGDDRGLVARMRKGDEQAFEEFFAASFPPLFRFASARLPDAAAAEDVVQAALSRAVTRLHGFRGEASLLSWLHTFCRHEISAWYESRSRRPPEVDLVEELPAVRAALESVSQGAPDAYVQEDELRRLVQAVLDALPGHYGDALEWKYVEGLSVAEIAERLGVGPKAAESLLTRARSAFRDAFLAVGGAARWPLPEAE